MPKRTKTARLTRAELSTLISLTTWDARWSCHLSPAQRRHCLRLTKLGLATGKAHALPMSTESFCRYRPTPAGRAHVRRCCEVTL